MSRRHLLLVVASLIAAGATAAGIVAATSGPAYPVHVPAGVNARLPRDGVALIVISRIGPDAAIERMDLLTDDSGVRDIEPNAARPVDAPPVGPVWVVRARGHFVGRRTPPGAPAATAKSGYFVIDDNTGEVLEMGMP